jgi:hypothetical protein
MGRSIQILFTLVLSLHALLSFAQTPVPMTELVDSVNSAWPKIAMAIEKASNKITVLPADPKKAKVAILALQESTKNPLATVVYHTGGILIDDGWIRILGSGHEQMKRNLPDWNKNKAKTKGFLLIADDVIGGFYLINKGELGTDTGKVYYFSPKDLTYNPMHMDYNGFLDFCFKNDLNKFYTGLRWKTWRTDVRKLDSDKVFIFLPFLWGKGSKSIDQSMRQVIPAEEKYFLMLEKTKHKNAPIR